MELYPSWDYLYTDFLRLPTVGQFKSKHFLNHYGANPYDQNLDYCKKNILQILTSVNANTLSSIQTIEKIGFTHLDLNLGCPSKTVTSHGGGSYLLSTPKELRKIIKEIRTNFSAHLSVKMRIGFNDDRNFISNIRLLEDEGVDLITIHARTKIEMYKGVADWSYIKQAVKETTIPIVANGDIWTLEDIDKIFDFADCHGVMMGRSALATPWISELFNNKQRYTQEELKKYFSQNILTYFKTLDSNYSLPKETTLKKFKSLSHYLFRSSPFSNTLTKTILRTKKLDHFYDELEKSITLQKNLL